MGDIIINAKKLTKTYIRGTEKINAVDNIDFTVRQGDFTAVMGPSGSGKTTLLDTLGCLDTITSGQLTVSGTDVSQMSENRLVRVRRENFGFIFQQFLLVPSLTVLENIALPLYFLGRSADNRLTGEMLEKVGLTGRKNHLPRELSGGECQRAAIARALITSPKVLFADEPTGNLDTQKSQEMFSMFDRLNKQDGLTILVATHNPELGRQAKNIINIRDGRIIEN